VTAASSSYPVTDILLPYKEVMTAENAGALARIVSDLYAHSSHKEKLTIFGAPLTGRPLKDVNYQPLQPKYSWLYGQNKGFLQAYLSHLKTRTSPLPQLVEIHSRCHLARALKTARPDLQVSLYLHNDATQMRGGTTIKDRQWLIDNLSAIIFVSDYLRRAFVQDLPEAEKLLMSKGTGQAKLVVIANEVTRTNPKPPSKSKTIICAGRMVPEKGMLEACMAAAQILPNFPDWHFHLVGGQHFRRSAASAYEQKLTAALNPIKTQSTQHGFLNGDQLAELQSQASIALVPSLWQEPAGLTVMEALMHGCALITTNQGGIPEIASGRAELVTITGLDYQKPADQHAIITLLAEQLQNYLLDPQKIRNLQDKAWHDFPYDAQNMAVNADRYRFSLKS